MNNKYFLFSALYLDLSFMEAQSKKITDFEK